MSSTKSTMTRPTMGSPTNSTSSVSTTSSTSSFSSRFSMKSAELKRQSKTVFVDSWYKSYGNWLAQVERDEQAAKMAAKDRKNSWAIPDLSGCC